MSNNSSLYYKMYKLKMYPRPEFSVTAVKEDNIPENKTTTRIADPRFRPRQPRAVNYPVAAVKNGPLGSTPRRHRSKRRRLRITTNKKINFDVPEEAGEKDK